MSQPADAVNPSTVQRTDPDPTNRAPAATNAATPLMAFKFRLYPSPKAAELLDRYAAAERAIYNRAVWYQEELRVLAARRRQLGGRIGRPRGELTYSDVAAWAAAEAHWLAEVPARVRSAAVQVARRALADSRRIKERRPPRFRSRYGATNGFSWVAASPAGELRKISGRWHEVRLPRCRGAEVVWCRVRVDADRQPPPGAHRRGKLLRITCDAAGTWWLTMTADIAAQPAPAPPASCGIDVGVVHTLTLADHTGKILHLDLPRLLSPAEARRLVRLQRALDRARRANPCGRRPCPHANGDCWKTSARYQQRRRQAAALRRRENRRARNWIERVTTHIADRYQIVAVEQLQIPAMTASAAGTTQAPGRNVAAKRGLNRAILQQRWGTILRRLEGKVTARGGHLLRVPAANTSRRCHQCGHTAAANRKTQAVFRCTACGHTDGADANAARNIHQLALQGHPPACGGPAAEPTGAPAAETDAEARP